MSNKNIITAYVNANYDITGAEFTPKKINLSKKTSSVTQDKLSLYNGGIKIGADVSKIKLSARIGYYKYFEIGEVDLVIYKNSSEIIRTYDTCFKASTGHYEAIMLNTCVVNVSQNDVIYLYISRNSNKQSTILGGVSTNLTVETID